MSLFLLTAVPFAPPLLPVLLLLVLLACYCTPTRIGKSATVIQYVEDHFVDGMPLHVFVWIDWWRSHLLGARTVYNPTIESTFRKAVRWRGEDVVLAIRDTTGQDEGTIFHPRNCAGVHGYMYVMDDCRQ